MENTLLAGDRIAVDKSAYKQGAGLRDIFSKRSMLPSRGDLVAFNAVLNKEVFNTSPLLKTAYLMRCIGIAGDTIRVVNKDVYVNNKIAPKPITLEFLHWKMPKDEPDMNIFPKGFKWNSDNYGPLVVPKAGMEIKIDSAGLEAWRVFILRENPGLNTVQSTKLISDILQAGLYTVKDDYLFMMGDNRNNAVDSRFFGFVNTIDVIGKALFVYYSSNPESGILWNRIGMNLK
jgi:signal peptidase I